MENYKKILETFAKLAIPSDIKYTDNIYNLNFDFMVYIEEVINQIDAILNNKKIDTENIIFQKKYDIKLKQLISISNDEIQIFAIYNLLVLYIIKFIANKK